MIFDKMIRMTVRQPFQSLPALLTEGKAPGQRGPSTSGVFSWSREAGWPRMLLVSPATLAGGPGLFQAR